MSYDKKTIIESHIDAIVRTLESLKHPYTIEPIGHVRCRGQNSLGEIPIRRLEYADRVVLERVIRTDDCDADDVVESHEFSRGNDPGAMWRWIIELSDEDDWPGVDNSQIDALRESLRRLVVAVSGARSSADGPFMCQEVTDAMTAAEVLLNTKRT